MTKALSWGKVHWLTELNLYHHWNGRPGRPSQISKTFCCCGFCGKGTKLYQTPLRVCCSAEPPALRKGLWHHRYAVTTLAVLPVVANTSEMQVQVNTIQDGGTTGQWFK
ncbi:hypothetical protein M405DRAFT_879088 [Rhizopogon salebrosus TDB-379]|nr:hypothetical protein M405DRAFT_879088 [Rhizopogon salebrosus TDB-379]